MLWFYANYLNWQLGFGSIEKRVNCWAHCSRLFDARLTHITDKVVRLAIRENIHKLQTRNSEPIFTKVKWSNVNDEKVNEFLEYFKDFNVSKSGWYEGYSLGDPSQTNGIESSHKHMKVFEDIKQRTPCIKFIKGKGKNMIEEQSKQRSSSFMRSDGNPLDNPNQKIYKEKPDIETHDWTRALKWDDKQFKFIKFSKSSSIYCTSDSDKQLDRQKCKNLFLYIENINIETDFDTLITKTDEIIVLDY